MRVLLLHHSLGATGAPKVALDAFQAMQGEVSVRSLALAGGPLEASFRQLGPVAVLPPLAPWDSMLNRAARRLGLISWTATLWKLLRGWRPDLIYANTIATIPIAAQLRLPQVPVLLHVYELESMFHAVRRLEPLLRQWPTRYIAGAKVIRDTLINQHGINDSRIALIHSFIPDRYCDIAPALRTRAPHEPFIVGGCGTPEWRKGTALWLLMAAELVKLLGDGRVRFKWVGLSDSHESWRFTEMVRKLHLERHVEHVPLTADPLSYFQQFDAFAMTSWEDSFPIVVLENMALRKPIVCFARGGGAPEELGEAGIVLDEFSPRRMAEALAELSQSPTWMAALGNAAYQRVRTRFTASIQVPKLLGEIRSLATTRRTPPAGSCTNPSWPSPPRENLIPAPDDHDDACPTVGGRLAGGL